MDDSPLWYVFDYVDPVSFVVEAWVRAAEDELGILVGRHPFEVVPPPAQPIDVLDEGWQARWEAARERYGPELRRPAIVPWTRKAHELALQALEQGCFAAVHEALFRAYNVEGRDIGRIDVLAEVAANAGLDPGEARTALGVDRHLERVLELRKTAERRGVAGVPTLLAEDRRLAGPVDADAVRAFLLTGR